MKRILNIIKTNWINIAGIFLATFIFAVILSLLPNNVGRSYNLFQAMFAALYLVCGYGITFWSYVIIALITLDILLGLIMLKRNGNIKALLFIEWLIISVPFTYGIIKYSEWIFLVGILAFLITQMRREKLIAQSELANNKPSPLSITITYTVLYIILIIILFNFSSEHLLYKLAFFFPGSLLAVILISLSIFREWVKKHWVIAIALILVGISVTIFYFI